MRQFPKCSKWLTHPAGICHRMELAAGVLRAFKGKSKAGGDSKAAYTTVKHSSLHDLFADMETQIVLPKSWK